MKIFDISWPISPTMTQYKDKKSVTIQKIEKDPYALEHLIQLSTHTGTHIDAPLHFLPDGAAIDQLPPDALIGPCIVVDMTQVTDMIRIENLKNLSPLAKNTIILFKTRNSSRAWDASFDYKFVFLAADAAQWLVQQEIKGIGIDYLGIEREQPAHETHITFFKANIPILEGLRLAHIKPGNYFLCALGLKLVGLEAAPARAILFGE
jgi:arylformamidase